MSIKCQTPNERMWTMPQEQTKTLAIFPISPPRPHLGALKAKVSSNEGQKCVEVAVMSISKFEQSNRNLNGKLYMRVRWR